MDATSPEYAFLDLTDINDEDRNSLTSALFASAPTQPPTSRANWSQSEKTTDAQVTWTDPNFVINDAVNLTPIYVVHPHTVDLSSCSSGTPGPPTASSSLDSLPTEREMAPHSPQRNPPAQTSAPPNIPPAPLAYSQPPPHVYPGPNSQNWPQHMMPPNVYVSQVTANVNVHGWGQYYQPQFTPHPQAEPRGRDGRDRGKGRRGGSVKRTQSPPTGQYLYYPQFYPTPQTAQGAPLYHMPFYPPMSYVYPYVQYMDYSMIDDPANQGEKAPEEYPDMIMEQEQHVAHDVYYPHPSCMSQAAMYDPNRSIEGPCPMEPYPQYYQLPPPQVPPMHQFNVHAKNFVRQNDHKNFQQQPLEMKASENVNHSMNPADSLPMKDLKITKPNMVPKRILEKPNPNQPQVAGKPPVGNNDKIAPKPAADLPKSAWIVKSTENTANKGPMTTAAQPPAGNTAATNAIKTVPPAQTVALVPNKISKNPSPAPFINNSFAKSGPPQPLPQVIMPQQDLPAKAPFTKKNNNKKETVAKPSDIPEQTESTPQAESKPAPAKPLLPVAMVQTNTSIPSKAPFGHARKSSVSETQAIASPPAPSPSDFPPPPAPRHSIDRSPVTPTVPQPAPSGNRTWASLFVSNTTAPVQNEEQTAPQPGTNATNPASAQRPIAKVGPFDSSPLQNENTDKTSTNNQKAANKENGKDSASNASPYIHDPISYRMGEFLAKYKLEHHTVSLQPRGLSNRSNYCYINAILQALIGCPPFYNMLKSMPYQLKKRKSNTPIIDAMVELCGEFSPLPAGVRVTRPERGSRNSPATMNGDSSEQSAPPVNVGPAFEPSTVLHMLRDMNNGESFRVEGRQEDAEEFLGCLLNGLNDEMLELIKLIEPDESKDSQPAVNGNDVSQESDDDDEWKVMGKKNKGSIERRCLAGRTPLSDIFRGQLRSRLQRNTDTTTTDTTHCVQPFFTLPLDIERSNSVREALEKVAGRDRLEGVTCPSKGRPVEAWQQVLLEQLPAVLVLHLKCFHSRPSDGATAKIVKTIDYPIDLKIDMKIISKTKCSTKQRSYKLFAVVYHEGLEAEKGHYLTDVYHVGCGGWLRYDDSVVTSVTEQQVLHPRQPRTPYLLLYRRQDTMQGPPRHQQTN